LRAEVKSPWLLESDEESWDEDEDEAEDEEADEDEADEDAEEEDEADEDAAPDDGVSGTWRGSVNVPEMGGAISFTMQLTLAADNSVTGTLSTDFGSGNLSGSFDPARNQLTLSATMPGMPPVTFNLTIDGNSMSGTADVNGQSIDISANRDAPGGGAADDDDEETEAREVVEIEFEGLERRSMRLPIPNGGFGQLAVNDQNHLIFVRRNTPRASGRASSCST
jgi:hypothetical protein